MAIPQQYRTWFEGVCKAVGLQDVEAACEESALVINDVPFFFVQGPVDVGPIIQVRVMVDVLPKQGGFEVLRRMLEIQLLLAGPGCPMFGLDPKSNLITMSMVVEPERLSPEMMAPLLVLAASTAEAWRETLRAPGPVQVGGKQMKLMSRLQGAQGG